MATTYHEYCTKMIRVELTESDINVLLPMLSLDNEQQSSIGQRLAKHTSRDWQQVFDHAMEQHRKADAS